MTCRHCSHPIRRCQVYRCEHGGWLHARTGLHACGTDHLGPVRAEPDPGDLPAVQAPGRKPQGEVA